MERYFEISVRNDLLELHSFNHSFMSTFVHRRRADKPRTTTLKGESGEIATGRGTIPRVKGQPQLDQTVGRTVQAPQ
jgi:hypothetical protein